MSKVRTVAATIALMLCASVGHAQGGPAVNTLKDQFRTFVTTQYGPASIDLD